MNIQDAIITLKKVNLDEYEIEENCYCVVCEAIRMKEIRKLIEKEEKLRGKIVSIL